MTLIYFTVEMELWRSTISVELPGRGQIIVSYDQLRFLQLREYYHILFTNFKLPAEFATQYFLHALYFIRKAQFEKAYI